MGRRGGELTVGSVSLWLRWSWRDFRRRWVMVGAIALVIALGTGTYAAFTGSATWRRESNDASFAALNTHDVKARLSAGTTVPEGSLLGEVDRLPADLARLVTGAEERLVLPLQVDLADAGKDLLVTGQVVGSGRPTSGPPVDGLDVSTGRAPSGSTVVLERQFAEFHHLGASGVLRVSGDRRVRFVGQGQSPEQFIISGEGGVGFFSHATYATVYATLDGAQRLTGSPGRVNDVVLTLSDRSRAPDVVAALGKVLATGPTPVSATVTTREEMPSYRLLYRDIDNDQKVWNVIAGLILAGAAFAAFNLTGRIVEATRREIGVGMAMGVPRSALALRPLLLGLQIALLGVLLGFAVGAAVGAAFAASVESLLPLPVWITDFQVSAFLAAGAIGVVLPMAAVAWPVWRAVRVQPVEAIRVGYLAGRTSGRARRGASRLPLARSSLHRMPVRNVLRTPRRTLLTALGIGASVATLVAIFGMLDSFTRTLDLSSDEITHQAPDRVAVQLNGFVADGSPELRRVTSAPGVGSASAGLSLPATLRGPADVDVLLETIGPDAVWSPTIARGTPARAADEIVLAEKAARDLGVDVGGRVRVAHPRRDGETFTTVTTEMRVAGIHPNPLRVDAYVSPSAARAFGFGGLANVVQASPATGVSGEDLQRSLFGTPAVASAQAVTTLNEALKDAIDQFVAILQIAAGVVLLLALLIAFNASSIAVDERTRENATMLAYGVPVRGLLGISTVESALTGLLGTLIGIGVGFAVVAWVTRVLFADTVPDLGIDPVLAWQTVATALVLGVVAVALAPLFTVRRLRRMDVPAALRVVE